MVRNEGESSGNCSAEKKNDRLNYDQNQNETL